MTEKTLKLRFRQIFSKKHRIWYWFAGAVFFLGMVFSFIEYKRLARDLKVDEAFIRRGVTGDFIAGFVGTTLSLVSTLLIVATLVAQREQAKDDRQDWMLQMKEERMARDREHLFNFVSEISSRVPKTDIDQFWHSNLKTLEYIFQFACETGERHDRKDEFMAIIKTIPRIDGLWTFMGSPFNTDGIPNQHQKCLTIGTFIREYCDDLIAGGKKSNAIARNLSVT
jgi:hypothetical protein